MDTVLTQLKEFASRFDPYFLKFLEKETLAYQEISPDTLPLIQEIKRMFEGGGKRLRPAQLYYSFLACGGKNTDAAVRAAVGVEMLHTFAVIHDDIIDQSDTRRGRPTSHKFFEGFHYENELRGDAVHFGVSQAILAGDLAFALADKSLTTSGFSGALTLKAKKMFDDLRTQLVAGQFLDVLGEYLPRIISEDDVIKILKYKSGYYTCGYPLLLGAILAGAGSKLEKELFEVGTKSGIAFQIQDDILGVFGREEQVGKSVDSDLREGKKTLLVIKAYQKATRPQKETLHRVLGNHQSSRDDLNKVRAILKETGAYDYARNCALKFICEAQTQLTNLPLKNPGKNFLTNLTQFLLEREF